MFLCSTGNTSRYVFALRKQPPALSISVYVSLAFGIHHIHIHKCMYIYIYICSCTKQKKSKFKHHRLAIHLYELLVEMHEKWAR